MKLFQIVNWDKIHLPLFFLIFLIGFFLRFYNISSIPPALYQDETSIGYNAYSVLETGKDEYGKKFPVYFKSFGDQKLPVYIYLTVLSEKMFGLNEFSVRLPSALLGSISIILLYFLIKELTKRKDLALLVSLFLAINPWHLHFSRAGFEVNVALFFALLGSLTFILGLRRKNLLIMLVSILSFVLSLYSYNLTRLLSPGLFLVLIFLYKDEVKKVDKLKIFVLGAVGFLALIPFIFTFFSDAGASSAKGALITSTDIESKLVELRGYYLYLPSIFTKIFFNKYSYLVWTYVSNLAGIISYPFFFVSGSLHGNQGIGNYGMFHVFELPLILIGVYKVFKERIKEYSFVISWAVLVILVLALSKEVPHATRGFFLVVPGVVFSALGFTYFYQFISKLRIGGVRYLILGLGVLLAFYSVVFYLTSYHQRFPVLYAKSWRSADKDLSYYLLANEKKYNRIVFDDEAGFMYSSLLFYQRYDPKNFQDSVLRDPDDSEGFSHVRSFGKYSFKKVNWSEDLIPGTLIVSKQENIPQNQAVLKTFSYPLRPVALSIKEELKQFAVEEPAYVLVEAK